MSAENVPIGAHQIVLMIHTAEYLGQLFVEAIRAANMATNKGKSPCAATAASRARMTEIDFLHGGYEAISSISSEHF